LSVVGERIQISRCPRCARLEMHRISVFEFSGRQAVILSCSCGFHKASIYSFRHRNYHIRMHCLACDSDHIWTASFADFWRSPVFVCQCVDSGMDISYLCGPGEVKDVVESLDGQVPSELSVFGDTRADFFVNPKIMADILNKVRRLTDRGDVYCQCGNDEPRVEVFGDRVELSCQECGSLCIVYAENENDLEVMRGIDCIELTESGFSCVDSRKFRHGPGTHRNKRHSD
jgi:hypothetical protein